MAAYKLIQDGDGVMRESDSAFIPNDNGNMDWCAYQAWIAEGNTPDPA